MSRLLFVSICGVFFFGAHSSAQTLSLSQTGAHACSVHSGKVRCWGTQFNGGLGNPVDESNKQVEVTGITTATAVAVGNSHSCAILSSGGMVCWGRGSEGQLGNAANPSVQRTPVTVSGLSGVVTAIALADFSTCAMISGGAVQCFGLDNSGELGNDAALVNSNVPVSVAGITTAQQISAGGRHFCARLGDGSARCWGSNLAGQLGDGTTTSRSTPVSVSSLTGVSDIRVATFHSCANTASGLKCWGNNLFGQLGTGGFGSSTTPVLAVAVSGTISALRAGGRHVCAQTSSAGLTCFGRNFDGQLSQPNNSGFSASGVAMQGLPGLPIIDFVLGTASSCLRFAEEDIRCVGSGGFGQLGDGVLRRWKSPQLASFDPAAELSLGAQRVCSKSPGIGQQCVGFNGFGGLGDGTTQRRLSLVSVSSGSATGRLTSSESQSCSYNIGSSALLSRCWGRNDVGQLGITTLGDQPIIVPAPALFDGSLVIEVTYGTFFGCAITEDSVSALASVRCWGRNNFGQLGDGTAVDRLISTSIEVPGMSMARQIVAGAGHACVRMFDGTVKCWGSDAQGELGDGATVGPVGVPVTVSGLSGVTNLAIARDGSHTCAVLNDNSVRCWGANSSGQIGNGTLINQNAPVVVSGGFSFSEVFTGISYSCGRLTSGAVRCWGSNTLDQLGVATSFGSSTPIVVDGLSANVTKLAGGPISSCALQSGVWKCWGYNSSGELGNGRAAVALLPVSVQSPDFLLADGFE
jgi:alpha-tubulin suppressor-like RCC1 family protein